MRLRQSCGCCQRSFDENSGSRVLDRHTARAKVEIGKARLRGRPAPVEALRDIEAANAVLGNESYEVFGGNATEVEFCGWSWLRFK